jgi:hypothetical protein
MLTAYAPPAARLADNPPARRAGLTNHQLARLAGALYLVVGVCGGFSQLVVRASVRVPGDPIATADNIRASAGLFRLGFVTDLVDITAFVLLGFALYVLLAPVNRPIAATFVVFVAIASAIMGANLINHVAALLVATNPTYSADLALLFLDLHTQGYLIAQIFFGLWLLPLGYLVYRSGWFPRALGVVLIVGGCAYLADLVAVYTSPSFESSLTVYLGTIAGLSEISFLVWLLVMGARENQ